MDSKVNHKISPNISNVNQDSMDFCRNIIEEILSGFTLKEKYIDINNTCKDSDREQHLENKIKQL